MGREHICQIIVLWRVKDVLWGDLILSWAQFQLDHSLFWCWMIDSLLLSLEASRHL